MGKLFQALPAVQDGLPPVDIPGLEKTLQEVLSECGERFRDGRADATYAQSDIAEINRKLDLIAGELAYQRNGAGGQERTAPSGRD
jgi:hypothetical protein